MVTVKLNFVASIFSYTNENLYLKLNIVGHTKLEIAGLSSDILISADQRVLCLLGEWSSYLGVFQ